MKIQSTLRVNAAFSLVSGTLFISIRNQLGQFIGYEHDLLYITLGTGLICFSIFLGLIAGSNDIKRNIVKAVVYMDMIWVLGSVILLMIPTPILVGGKMLIAFIAIIVMTIAILQNMGVKHLK